MVPCFLVFNGGFDLGLERAGFEIAWQVEIDEYATKVLTKHWPTVPKYGDIRSIDCGTVKPVTVLCGGFPCQDLSVAGKRAGLTGERSGLFHEFTRIAKTLKPQWGLVENVPGLFSSCGGRDLATVLEGLRECWPVVGYAVLDSQYFGVPQRRRRVFFVGGPSEHSVEQVLFECQGVSGDLTTGEEAGTHVASSLRGRSSRPGVNPPGRGGEDDMNIVCAPLTGKQYADQLGDESKLVCQALTNLGSGGPDDNEAQAGHLVTHTLTGRHDSSEDGIGRGVPLCLTSWDSSTKRIHSIGGPVATLASSDGKGGQRTMNIQTVHGVRRLTPTECERIQGFPDGWTCLCQPLESYDSARCTCADGPRYKTMGNAVTVQVIEYIGRRILAV